MPPHNPSDHTAQLREFAGYCDRNSRKRQYLRYHIRKPPSAFPLPQGVLIKAPLGTYYSF